MARAVAVTPANSSGVLRAAEGGGHRGGGVAGGADAEQAVGGAEGQEAGHRGRGHAADQVLDDERPHQCRRDGRRAVADDHADAEAEDARRAMVSTSAQPTVAAMPDVSPVSMPLATAPPNPATHADDAHHQPEAGGDDGLAGDDHPAGGLGGDACWRACRAAPRR